MAGHNDPNEHYVPDDVDEQLAALLHTGQGNAPDLRLADDLLVEFSMHIERGVPAHDESESSLARVLARLLEEDAKQQARPNIIPLSVDFEKNAAQKGYRQMEDPFNALKSSESENDSEQIGQQERGSRRAWDPHSRQNKLSQKFPIFQKLNTLVAVITALVLVGAMLGVFGLARTHTGGVSLSTTPTPVSTPTPNRYAAAFPPSTPLICAGTRTDTGQISFVKSQGEQLMYKGSSIKLYGYTFYPTTDGGSPVWHQSNFTSYIDNTLKLGSEAGQNLIRPTDYWYSTYQGNTADDATIWKNMDYLVCAAQQQGVFVEMDVSAFAWYLESQGQSEYNLDDWTAFLDAVGKHYRNQSSIAYYSILGEPAAPTSTSQMNTLVNFYRSTTNALHAADPNHLVMAGGFNNTEDETSTLDWWQQIYALPHNDLIGFKTYSQADLNLIPTIASYAQQIDKPLIDEEFGMPQSQGDGTASGATYNGFTVDRAQFYAAVYSSGNAHSVAGFIFWNLGCQIADSGYDVSPQTPAVWGVVKQYAPAPVVSAGVSCPYNG